MNIKPKTHMGKISVASIIILFLVILFLCANAGEKGGDHFFSNLKLAIPMIVGALSAIVAAITGITSIIKDKEKSVLVYITTIIGFLIILYISAELLFPH